MVRRDVGDVVPPRDHFGISGVAEDRVEPVDELFGVVFGVIRLNDKATTTTTMTTSTVRKKPKELQLRNLTLNYIIFSFIFILSAVGSSPFEFLPYQFKSVPTS